MKITIEDKKNKTIITTEPVVENGKTCEKIKMKCIPSFDMTKEETSRPDVGLGLAIMRTFIGDEGEQ